MPGTAAGNGLGASPCAGSQKTCPIGQFMAEPGQTRTFHVTEPVPAPSMPQTAHGARQETDHDPPTDQSPQAGPRSLQGDDGTGGELRHRQPRTRPEGTGETARLRSAEHTSEIQSLMRFSYAVFC